MEKNNITKLDKLDYKDERTISLLETALKLAKEGTLREIVLFSRTDTSAILTTESTFKDKTFIITGMLYALLDCCGVAYKSDIYEDDSDAS